MVAFLAPILAFFALVSSTSADHRTFTNFPSEFKVGQLVTLTWDLNPGEAVGRLTLQHEDFSGAVLQYETICQWDDASGLNSKGLGVTSIDWIPNVAGPAFNLILNDNHIYSPQFSILAADGTPVNTVPSNIDPFSNIEPQTATPIWYPNDPHKGAATTSQAPAAPVTIVQASATPTIPVIVSSPSTELFSTISAVAAITTSMETVSFSGLFTPFSVSTITMGTPSSRPFLSTSLATTTPYPSSAASTSTSLASYPSAPSTTLATSTVLPASYVTSTQQMNSTTGLAAPTQPVTNAAAVMWSSIGAVVMAVAGCALALVV